MLNYYFTLTTFFFFCINKLNIKALALLSSCCHNNEPQTGWLKQQQRNCLGALEILETRSPVMVLAEWVLSGGRARRSCSKPSPLAYRWLFSSSHSILPVCLSASKFPLRTPVMLNEDHLMIWLYFGDLYKDLTSLQRTGGLDFNLWIWGVAVGRTIQLIRAFNWRISTSLRADIVWR